GGPRQPPRGPSGLLVALAFGGGHDAGQVDAYGDGPGHPAGLAVFGGGVADVGERSGRRDRGQHYDRPGVGDCAQQPVHAARRTSTRASRAASSGSQVWVSAQASTGPGRVEVNTSVQRWHRAMCRDRKASNSTPTGHTSQDDTADRPDEPEDGPEDDEDAQRDEPEDGEDERDGAGTATNRARGAGRRAGRRRGRGARVVIREPPNGSG